MRRARVDATDMGADLEDVLITPERLQERVLELAAQIDADYAGRELLLVGVLKGAVMVMADLPQPRQTFMLEKGLYDKPRDAVSRPAAESPEKMTT